MVARSRTNGISEPPVVLGSQPIALAFAARAGRGIGLAPGEDEQAIGLLSSDGYAALDVIQIESALARLEGLEIPALVAIQQVKAVWNCMAGHQHQCLHGAQTKLYARIC